MEDNQSSSIFDTEMDGNAQVHLASIGKWAKIISIIGFVFCGLILLMLAAYSDRILTYMNSVISSASTGAGIIIAIAVLLVLLFTMLFYFLFRSSMLLQRGAKASNSADIADGFKSLRTFFILSIVLSTIFILSNLITILNS